MTAPRLIRILVVSALGLAAAGCAMNPFDGDPNGPPPAPSWKGAYSGDADVVDDRDFADRRRRDVADDEGAYDAAPPVTHRPTPSVETAAMPPPGATPLPPPPAAAPVRSAADPLPPPPEPRGERTLTTRKADAAHDKKAPSGPDPATANPSGATTSATAAAPASRRTKTHVVTGGEELSDIADAHGVREVDIIAANGLRPPYTLKKGQELIVPVQETADAPEPRAKPAATGALVFDWPVTGKIIAGYGPGANGLYNEGINIAVPTGTPVRASADGTVRYAGNELRGYGNLVLIEHANGYVTAYAHNDTLTVKRGASVKRGEVIARSGQTGNVTTPQLHFEIRKGTQSLDPKPLLVAVN